MLSTVGPPQVCFLCRGRCKTANGFDTYPPPARCRRQRERERGEREGVRGASAQGIPGPAQPRGPELGWGVASGTHASSSDMVGGLCLQWAGERPRRVSSCPVLDRLDEGSWSRGAGG